MLSITRYLRIPCIVIVNLLIFGVILGFTLRKMLMKMSNISSPYQSATTTTQIVLNSTIDYSSCATFTANFRMNLTTFWSFNLNTLDSLNISNGIASNSPSYYQSYAGIGQSIMFDGINQFMMAPFIPLYNRSFTIELFAFLNVFSHRKYVSILSQCDNITNATQQCLNLGILNATLFFGLNDEYLIGTTRLVHNQWYHFAFVFDLETRDQMIYLNGQLDGRRLVANAYDGTFGNTNIGYSIQFSNISFFPGYMDSFAIYNTRAKSECEIKSDGTLYAYYSWDNDLGMDDGPNKIDGNFSGLPSFIPGYLGMGIHFNYTNVTSYFVANGFSILGSFYSSFSTSIWVKPTAFGGSILFIARFSTGIGNCHPIIGMKVTGEPVAILYDGTQGLYSSSSPSPLPLNQWSHLVQTFNALNGLRLYVNGTLKGSTSGYFTGSRYPMYLFVGASGEMSHDYCVQTSVDIKQFLGTLDELRIFNYELTQVDVAALFNI